MFTGTGHMQGLYNYQLLVYCMVGGYRRIVTNVTSRVCSLPSMVIAMQPVLFTSDAPEPNSLQHSVLIKNASTVSVESSTNLLSYVTIALVEAFNELESIANDLITKTEQHLAVLGKPELEDEIWQEVIECRTNLADAKKTISELEMLFSSASNLISAAAEVAFKTGAETSSVMAMERLQSANVMVDQARKRATEMEDRLIRAHVRSIELIGKKADEI